MSDDLRRAWTAIFGSSRLRACLAQHRAAIHESITGEMVHQWLESGEVPGFARTYAYRTGFVLPGLNQCASCHALFVEHGNGPGSCRYHAGPFEHRPEESAHYMMGPGQRPPAVSVCKACSTRIETWSGRFFDAPHPYDGKGCRSKAHVAALPATDFGRSQEFDARRVADWYPPVEYRPGRGPSADDAFGPEPPTPPGWPSPSELLDGR